MVTCQSNGLGQLIENRQFDLNLYLEVGVGRLVCGCVGVFMGVVSGCMG